MIEIAKRDTPPRMGSELADIIVACLTCLEGGMGDKEDFEQRPGVATVRFDGLLLETFPNQRP